MNLIYMQGGNFKMEDTEKTEEEKPEEEKKEE